MKIKKDKYLFALLGIVLGLLLSLAACAPRTESPFRDYYVSTTGSDSTGDGSEARPWRTIQYAHDHADYSGRPVQLHIAEGRYMENLTLSNSLTLRGAGAGDPLSDTGLTIIEWATAPSGRDAAHLITGDHVEIYDLVFQRGRVRATGNQAVFENVWFHWVQGLFGLQLEGVGAFTVENSEFRTQPRVYADYGIDVINSTGEIIGGFFGDYLDHAINISRYPDAPVMIVNVDGATVRGSPICYADGIRVSGAPIVYILNSDIRREHADVEPSCTPLGGPIRSDGVSAGIGLQRVPVSGGIITQTISGNTVWGFDVGMAFDVRRTRVKAEGNNIAGLTYGVLAWRWPDATTNGGSILDFGRGPLGSTGGNIFADSSPVAFYNDETYDVSACDNDWVVRDDLVDGSRIFDQLDDPSKGRVFWFCLREPIEAGPTEPLAEIFTPTPTDEGPATFTLDTDANCRSGDSSAYQVVTSFNAGQSFQIDGRNAATTWFWVLMPQGGHCWLASSTGTASGPYDAVAIITLPTATPTQPSGDGDGDGDGDQEPEGPEDCDPQTEYWSSTTNQCEPLI